MSADPLDRVKRFFAEGGEDSPASAGASAGRPRIGKYEIVREVARGGMAVVYEALDPDLGRRVALKVLREGNVERLRREAAAAAKLRHPNVVTVHEVGPDFIVMDLVEGRTLADLLPTLDVPGRLRILETIAGAVGHAHAEGVVHRDLKPANVLIETGGRVVLTDFGLARIAGSEALTRTGAVVGTPLYMAPEQVRGEASRIGPATDVWALGVLLFEMAFGRMPFEGETALAIYEQVARHDPAFPAGDLGAIAAKALEKDPGRRYADARAMAEDLRRARQGEPVSVRLPGTAGRLWRRVRKNRTTVALGTAVVLVAALALAGRGERTAPDFPETAKAFIDAALALRREGSNAGMRKFLPPLETAYREARERAPDRAEVEYFMGRMHRVLLEEPKALEYQEKALAKDPNFGPALYERAVLLSMKHGRELKAAYESLLGVELIEGGRPDLEELRDAILRDVRAFLRSGAGGPEARVAEGLFHYHGRQYGLARQKLEEAMRLDPLLEEAREALAQVVRAELLPDHESRERAWRQTEELYTQGLAKDAGYVPHYFARGQLRWMRGSRRRHRGMDPSPDYGGAEQDFAKAIELDPGSFLAWTWRGQMRVYQAVYRIEIGQDPRERCGAAEEDLKKAIELSPGSDGAWMWRGNARFYRAIWKVERGLDPLPDFEASERDLSEALRLRSEVTDSWRWRGRMRAQHGSAMARAGRDPSETFKAADEDFARAVKNSERDSWYWSWRGTVGIERGLWKAASGADPGPDFDVAEGHITKAISLNTDHMEAWKYRGFVHWHRAQHREAAGDRRGARESYAAAAADFHRAMSINPTLRHQIGDRMERAQKKAAESDNP